MLVLSIRALILYLIVIAGMRIMGKRQIGQLQPYELVLAVIIAELVVVPMEDIAKPLAAGIVPVVVLVSAELIISFVSLKSERVRGLVCGKPSVVVEHGRIVESELRRSRLNLNDLLEQLRLKNYANVADVEFAILETGGQLSVIPKADKRPVNPTDLSLAVSQEKLPVTVIMDGKVNYANLKKAGLSQNWLDVMLANNNIADPSQVFFASIESDGQVFIQLKEKDGALR